MEYLVTMTTHVPDGTSEEAVADVRAREAARTAPVRARRPRRTRETRGLSIER